MTLQKKITLVQLLVLSKFGGVSEHGVGGIQVFPMGSFFFLGGRECDDGLVVSSLFLTQHVPDADTEK